MKTRVQKWGNSLALRIPRAYAAELDLEDGSPAAMSVEEGALVIRPDRERSWDFDVLLAGVTDENIHPEWEAGSIAGSEDRERDQGKWE
jgi:antitoxin MazE